MLHQLNMLENHKIPLFKPSQFVSVAEIELREA